MIPTPDTSHLKDFRDVYEPAEDTFILLDALEQDAERLKKAKVQSRLCLEIGPGSGCVGAFLSNLLFPASSTMIVCADINPRAIEATLMTSKVNNVANVEPILCNALSAFAPRLSSKDGLVDILLFNPPYVPTSVEEEDIGQSKAGIEGSWAGGNVGTRLVNDLILHAGGHNKGLETVLSPHGSFYLVAIKQNDPEELVQKLQKRNLQAEIILSRKAGREHLFVIRATKCIPE